MGSEVCVTGEISERAGEEILFLAVRSFEFQSFLSRR